MIFITAIWPVIINIAVGVRNVPQDYRNVGRVLRLSPAAYFFKTPLPAAAPYIFTGLRIGAGMSWLAIVASEMLLGGVGVGFFIWDQYNASRISDIVVALVWVGLGRRWGPPGPSSRAAGPSPEEPPRPKPICRSRRRMILKGAATECCADDGRAASSSR